MPPPSSIPRSDSPLLRHLQLCPHGCAKPKLLKGAPHGTHLAAGQLPQRRSHCQGPQGEHGQGGGGGGTPGEQEPKSWLRQRQPSPEVVPYPSSSDTSNHPLASRLLREKGQAQGPVCKLGFLPLSWAARCEVRTMRGWGGGDGVNSN